MKAYGIPREDGVEWPDVEDIRHYGLATRSGHVIRSVGKQKTRRYWKKQARREAAEEIREDMVLALNVK